MIEQAIYSRTSTYSGLTALGIGANDIYPETIEESAAYPVIRFSLIDDPDVGTTHDDTTRPAIKRGRFQFDVFTEGVDPFLAKQIRDQLELCWSNYKGVVSTVTIRKVTKVNAQSFGYDEVSELHREMIEFYFWYMPN